MSGTFDFLIGAGLAAAQWVGTAVGAMLLFMVFRRTKIALLKRTRSRLLTAGVIAVMGVIPLTLLSLNTNVPYILANGVFDSPLSQSEQVVGIALIVVTLIYGLFIAYIIFPQWFGRSDDEDLAEELGELGYETTAGGLAKLRSSNSGSKIPAEPVESDVDLSNLT